MEVCGRIAGISVIQFGEKDVVRHNLVQQIIRAYEEHDMSHPQRAGNGKLKTTTPGLDRTEKSGLSQE
jgi:phosphate starvation-inducible PhoH-like protein